MTRQGIGRCLPSQGSRIGRQSPIGVILLTVLRMAAMRDPTAARRYLESVLPLGHWAAASYAIGRDHAYIQQYIRRGAPWDDG